MREEKMEKKTASLLFSMIFLVSFVFSGCGNSNLFSFGHTSGSSTTVSSLSSDAMTALQNKDYAKALDLYKKILASDPGNSEAIYGYSTSTLSNAGLDFPSLVANLINQHSAPSVVQLTPTYAVMPIYRASYSQMLPQSIIVNISAIQQAVQKILGPGYLWRVIRGQTDGVIAPDNPDVNINIAFLLVLEAAVLVYNDSGGAAYFNSDYSVTSIDGTRPQVQLAAKDLCSAVNRLVVVANKLKLASDATINKIKSDINTLLSKIPNLPSSINTNTDFYYNDGTF